MTGRIDATQARARLLGSRLFDAAWYAEAVGVDFPDRASAVAHWVANARTTVPHGITPHPLFAPLWLWPGGRRWSRVAPDPLSYWLLSEDEQARSPHPLVDLDHTGPLESWLDEHDPSELLPRPAPRFPDGAGVVVVQRTPLRRAVGWIRHFRRHPPSLPVELVAPEGSARLLKAVAADVPAVRVVSEVGPRRRVEVTVGRDVRPPSWSWLPELLEALDRPGTAAAQPLLLAPDFTVAAAGVAFLPTGVEPLLKGMTVDDAVRLAGLPLAAAWTGVLALRTDLHNGDTVLAPSSRVVVDQIPERPQTDPPVGAVDRTRALLRAAGFETPGVPIRRRNGVAALRWSIDVAAGATQPRWGDVYFARSLAAALERLGQWVVIDHPETRGRPSRALEDVSLTLRGLHEVSPRRDCRTNLMWVISHPDLVTPEECAKYDAVFAAGPRWAERRSREWGLPIQPLLQCTDADRFRPGLADATEGTRAVFVGNSRHVLRLAVGLAIDLGLPLDVYGAGWDPWLPTANVRVVADHVSNSELGRLYAGAAVVLNDHWDDMRVDGFVSNRVFDVLACGGRLVTDEVTGLREALSDEVAAGVGVFRSPEDLLRLAGPSRDEHFPDAAARAAIAERVLAEHSFDARARTLLATVRALRGDS